MSIAFLNRDARTLASTKASFSASLSICWCLVVTPCASLIQFPRADFLVAAALGNRPKFPFLNTNQEYYLPVSILEKARHPPLDGTIRCDDPNEQFQIFVQIRQLLLTSQSSRVSLEKMRILVNIVDDSILQYLYQDCARESSSNKQSRALVSAAHILMYVVLRQVPPGCPLVRSMCRRLQNTIGLAASVRAALWKEKKPALLWVAFVGMLATRKGVPACVEGQWFLNLFQSTIRDDAQCFDPVTVDNLGRIMSGFLWDKSYCEPLLADLLELYSR